MRTLVHVPVGSEIYKIGWFKSVYFESIVKLEKHIRICFLFLKLEYLDILFIKQCHNQYLVAEFI